MTPDLFDFAKLPSWEADLVKGKDLKYWKIPESVCLQGVFKPNKQRQVLDMLIRDGSTTAFDIQKATNSTDSRKIISRLRKLGYIGKTEMVIGHSGIKHALYYWSGKND